MGKVRLAVLAFGLSIGLGAQAADDTNQWLVKAALAARMTSYEGVLVYRGDNVLETFRVTHRFANGSERERVQSMTGEVREVLKQNDKLTCLLPKDLTLTARRGGGPGPKGFFQALSPERLQQISSVYELKELGVARVAGRRCRGIAIAPRDQFRYGYEVWADQDTGVPLKLSLVGPDGNLLEQMFFTEVKFPDTIPDSAFEAVASEAQLRESTETAVDAIAQAHELEPVVIADAVRSEGAEQAKFSKLPPGFGVVRRQFQASPAGVREHIVLSDGLSAVSVYRVLPRDPEALSPVLQRLDRMGPMNAYSRRVGKVHITVVGEVPSNTIRMIGDNMEAANETRVLKTGDALN